MDVRQGRLLGLRKRAAEPAADRHPERPERPDGGRDRLSVPFRDAEVLGEELASYGPNVVVVAPAELAAAVRRRLTAAADFAAAPVPPIAFPDTVPAQARRANAPPRTSSSGCCSWCRSWSTTRACTSATSPPASAITRKELEDDLRILICSGLPEGYPDDLLDIQWEDDHVFITQDLDLNRPVRFTVDEACALLTGLETLNGLPELAEGGALESVTLKLMAAAGEEGLQGRLHCPAPRWARRTRRTWTTIRQAIRTGVAAAARATFPPQRDSVSERDVDPLRLYSLDNTWYFEAYCHSAGGLRNFRLDRIEGLAAERPAGVRRRRSPAAGFPGQAVHPERRRHPGHGPAGTARAPASPTTTTPNGRRRCPDGGLRGRDPVRQHRLAADVRGPAWRGRPDPGAGGACGRARRNGSTRPWPSYGG